MIILLGYRKNPLRKEHRSWAANLLTDSTDFDSKILETENEFPQEKNGCRNWGPTILMNKLIHFKCLWEETVYSEDSLGKKGFFKKWHQCSLYFGTQLNLSEKEHLVSLYDNKVYYFNSPIYPLGVGESPPPSPIFQPPRH